MSEHTKPAPLENRPGKQKDDNIDDLGRRRDGQVEDQPTGEETEVGQDNQSRRNGDGR